MREGLEASFCGGIPISRRLQHGGLCAVATLIDLCGVAPLDAWNGIRAARPVFSEGHVALLNARYPGNNFGCDAAPAWYGPQVEGDEEDDPEIDDEAPPPQKKRTHEDAAEPPEAKPRNKRPKLHSKPPPRRRRRLHQRPAPRRPADAGRPRDGARRHARSRIGGPLHDLRDVPACFRGGPDAYDKDLPKVARYASFTYNVAGDRAGLAGLLKCWWDRKKAAVLCRGPPRIYLPPQEIGADGGWSCGSASIDLSRTALLDFPPHGRRWGDRPGNDAIAFDLGAAAGGYRGGVAEVRVVVAGRRRGRSRERDDEARDFFAAREPRL